MKVLIMGSGAVGGYFGSVLYRDGHDVQFVARGNHLDAISRDGLRVESVTSGNFTINPPVMECLDGQKKADLVLFCVKSYDNAEAIRTMEPAVGQNTVILTLQNGLGSGDELARFFGGNGKVLLGVTYVDAVLKNPGVVAELGGRCSIIFGDVTGNLTSNATEVRDALCDAGIDVNLSSDVRKELWNKLIFICALSGMTCITRVPIGQVLSMPETLDLTWKVMLETEAVGRAHGVDLNPDIVEISMEILKGLGESGVSSMYMDLERGKRLEVAVINGAIHKLGNELHVETPMNSFINACLLVSHNRALNQYVRS